MADLAMTAECLNIPLNGTEFYLSEARSTGTSGRRLDSSIDKVYDKADDEAWEEKTLEWLKYHKGEFA